MRRRTLQAHAVPFVGANEYRSIAGTPPALFIAVLSVGDGYFCIEYQIGVAEVVAFVIKHDDLVWRYRKLTEAAEPQIAALKSRALEKGATLEAIQLLGALTPLTKTEELQMAEAKLSRKTADTAALKGAAAKAPVAPKGKAAAAEPAKRGNAEALAKARAAKADSGPDNRKITVLKKDHGARAGTTRADLLNSIFKAKTVQAAVDGGVKKSDVAWAARAGYISLG